MKQSVLYNFNIKGIKEYVLVKLEENIAATKKKPAKLSELYNFIKEYMPVKLETIYYY